MKEKLINALKWFYKSFIWLFVVLLALDIATKQIILSFGKDAGSVISDWGFVHISYVLNTNAAFGLGSNNPVVSRTVYLIVATLVSIGLIVYLVYKRKETKLFIRASLIMVITGAIGNMIDRIFYGSIEYGTSSLFTGAVVDWIDFYWFWPFVFNIADCCIVIAAFMLIVYVIVGEVKEVIARRKAEQQEVVTLSKSEQERLDRENNNEENKE